MAERVPQRTIQAIADRHLVQIGAAPVPEPFNVGIHNQIGSVYVVAGDARQALHHFQQSNRVSRSPGQHLRRRADPLQHRRLARARRAAR